MKKSIFIIIGLVLFLASKGDAYDDGDFQVWNTNTEEIKIGKKSKIAVEEEFRWGNNAGEFYYQHYDLGFSHSLQKWFNIAGGYRHVYELKKGDFKQENEPYVTATFLWDFKGFKFDDRNRVEYRYFDYQDDSWRYRNKITVKFPWAFTGWNIQPYLSDEILIGFSTISELNQNRFSCGFGMNLTKNVKAEMYYLLQSAKSSGHWVDTNVLGIKFKIIF